MKKLLALALMVPVVSLALTSPAPTHKWAEDTSVGNIPDVPMNREWTVVRVDTTISYIRYLFEHQQALVLPAAPGRQDYYLYFAYNDAFSHVRVAAFGEPDFTDPASWVVQDIYEWTGAGTLRYVAPSAYNDGAFWYPEVSFNCHGPSADFYMLDEGGLMAGIWSNPYDILDGRQYDYYLPLSWAGTDNVVYIDGQARDAAGDSHYFQSIDGWTGDLLDPPGEVLIFPAEDQYGANPVWGQGFENSQLHGVMGAARADRVVIALGGYRLGDYVEGNPLTIVYKESMDGGTTWGDNVWVDQALVADMPGSDPGIQGHYSNSFFDMLIDMDGDLHFAAVIADSGHYANDDSEILGLYDIHQNDGVWTATMISDGVYDGFDPGAQYLDGDKWMHSPSLSIHPDGPIIACWNDIGWNDPVDTLVSLDIYVAGSADGGNTWSEPILITETSDVDEYFSRLTTCTTQEFAYVLTMYDGVDGPLDCIQIPIEDILGVGADDAPVPVMATLGNATPNPFADEVSVSLNLPSATKVDAKVYNAAGELVQTIHTGSMDAGTHQLVFDGQNASAGVYFIKVDTGERTMSERVVLVK